MKNKLFLLLFSLAALSFSSCDMEESLDPLPTKVNGQFVKLDVTSDRLNYNDLPNAYFGGTLSCPSNNVAKYELYIRRETGSGVTADYVLFTTVTSFPAQLRVTPATIAQALGVEESVLQNGDTYRFYAISYDFNGRPAQYRDLSRNIATERTLKQAYRFKTIMATDMDNFFDIYNLL